ncbi:uncharacterized protein Bfra_004980 [Botrytis fragariae]|uniref:2EXR domain-containing protein n=1 Tax=Botrytis fragariae TaxID=1964551 RepID=A0A8H6ATI7_9HELO|nr:uncharacterized protein Bfra_004980 [Botrytis fragariae]KAF5873518.1 hypothetical protein Bfra_004980 [Botrytis fragariae]
MGTSSQKNSQRQDIASPGYLMASQVEDRGSIGCGMATAAILDDQVMTNNEVKPVAIQNKFQTNYTSVTPVSLVNLDSEYNTDNDPTPPGKEKFEAAYYSPEMFNFFEMQVHRNGLLSIMDATASADSFILFTFLPIELQRKIWFYALPPPDSNVWALVNVRYCDNDTKAAISIDNDASSISRNALPFPDALQSVCRTAREIFLKHYSQFKFDGINKKIRDPEDEDGDDYREMTVMAKPGIWFDTEVDTLHLTNMYLLPMYTDDYKVSMDLTGLRSLTIDLISMQWVCDTKRDMDIFWTGLESHCHVLERLTIVLNNIREFPRVQRAFDGTSPEHRFQDFDEAFIEQLRHSQYVQPRIHSDKLERDIQRSCELWETRSLKAKQANMDYWKKIDLRPVWMVYITSFYVNYISREIFPGPFMAVQTYGFPTLFIRCNEDGSLLDEYDHFKELFDEEDEKIVEPFEEERLIVIGDD